jgi:hypothetical protein
VGSGQLGVSVPEAACLLPLSKVDNTCAWDLMSPIPVCGWCVRSGHCLEFTCHSVSLYHSHLPAHEAVNQPQHSLAGGAHLSVGIRIHALSRDPC